MGKNKNRNNLLRILIVAVILVFGGLLFLELNPGLAWWQSENKEEQVPDKIVSVSDNEEIEGGVHVATGLVADNGLNEVIANCTGCHSSQLIIQNRATREGWLDLIRWMQETQNLWDLGDNEALIVSYLAKHYAPEGRGRRAPLTDIEWYELKE